ncbi:MAG TPA: radical SAM protein [Dissulfurispiraceae bacterium]|nr:radical SAM protein [Dissulfurispiraceae bacterium]
MLRVCEIFASMQGESTHAGRPCVFLRLSGCNLRCSYCDTSYAYQEGNDRSLDDIARTIASFGIPLVELTGGEPLLQAETPLLAQRLCDNGFEVLLETNGSFDISNLDPRIHVVMDIKTPSSGTAAHTHWMNIGFLKKDDEVKFVLEGRPDYEWARRVTLEQALASKCTVLYSPVFGRLLPSDLASWILEDRLPVRLNLQIHKYIWPPDMRGV